LKRQPTLFRIEATLSVVTGLLGVVTLFWRDWIEATTGWDPDKHSGSLEWAIVAVLILLSLSLALLARRELRPASAR
jgi:DMSO/TMAO reductase YedYZ heme-binding membrane subunit